MSDYAGVCTQDVEHDDEIRESVITTTGELGPVDMPLWENAKTDEASTLAVHRLKISNDWLQDALRTLEALEQLPSEWDSTGAEPPNPKAIENSQLVLTELADANLKPTLIEPSTDDGVCIGFWAGNRYADIECFNDGEILAMTHDRGNSEPEICGIQPNEISETIEKLQTFLGK